jgi:hypothetical protein
MCVMQHQMNHPLHSVVRDLGMVHARDDHARGPSSLKAPESGDPLRACLPAVRPRRTPADRAYNQRRPAGGDASRMKCTFYRT